MDLEGRIIAKSLIENVVANGKGYRGIIRGILVDPKYRGGAGESTTELRARAQLKVPKPNPAHSRKRRAIRTGYLVS